MQHDSGNPISIRITNWKTTWMIPAFLLVIMAVWDYLFYPTMLRELDYSVATNYLVHLVLICCSLSLLPDDESLVLNFSDKTISLTRNYLLFKSRVYKKSLMGLCNIERVKVDEKHARLVLCYSDAFKLPLFTKELRERDANRVYTTIRTCIGLDSDESRDMPQHSRNSSKQQPSCFKQD